MLVTCIKNYKAGLFGGFDYKTEFTVGKTYQFFGEWWNVVNRYSLHLKVTSQYIGKVRISP